MELFVGLGELVPLGTLLLAVVAAIVGLRQYGHGKRVERMRVLLELHQRFMDTEKYCQMRIRIDDEDRELLALIDQVANDPDHAQDEGLEDIAAFDEYLAFFDLLAHLWKTGLFDLEDIDGLFGYFIRNAAEKDEIRRYLAVEEFSYGPLRLLTRELAKVRGRKLMPGQSL